VQHRHSKQVDEALSLLKRLAQQVDGQEREGGENDEDEGEQVRLFPLSTVAPLTQTNSQGVIANLERAGWTHTSTTNGIRIFSSQDPNTPSSAPPGAVIDRAQSVRTADGRGALSPSLYGVGTPRTSTAPATRGLRADETLPFFRGEGWVEGAWRREDVAYVFAFSEFPSFFPPLLLPSLPLPFLVHLHFFSQCNHHVYRSEKRLGSQDGRFEELRRPASQRHRLSRPFHHSRCGVGSRRGRRHSCRSRRDEGQRYLRCFDICGRRPHPGAFLLRLLRMNLALTLQYCHSQQELVVSSR
jgi:hypothetical protein